MQKNIKIKGNENLCGNKNKYTILKGNNAGRDIIAGSRINVFVNTFNTNIEEIINKIMKLKDDVIQEKEKRIISLEHEIETLKQVLNYKELGYHIKNKKVIKIKPGELKRKNK